MPNDLNHCAHCQTAIVDPTTQVVHGDMTYCCANCASAMEQQGSGSDPGPRGQDEQVRCAHCGAPIVHDSTLTERNGQMFCCPNCAQSMQTADSSRAA